MRKYNNKNKNKNSQKLKNPRVTNLCKTVNIYANNSGTEIQCNNTQVIYVGPIASTYNYTFTAGSDVRYYSFASLFNAQIITNAITTYQEYRIMSSCAILTPLRVETPTTAALQICGTCFLSIDPEAATATNPSNNNITTSQNSHMFSPNSLDPKAITYRFPGVGVNIDIWQPVGTAPIGSFYIGAIVSATSTLAGTAIFDAVLSLRIQFRGIKSH
jgi:hypothetical protein